MNSPVKALEVSPRLPNLRRAIGKTRRLWPTLPLIVISLAFAIAGGMDFIFSVGSLISLGVIALAVLIPRAIAAFIRLICGAARGDLASDTTEALLIACGWITSLSLAGALFHSLARYLPDKLSGTWLGAGALPIAVVLSLLIFAVCAFVTLRTPFAFARWRLSGTRHATAVVDALTTGIGWFMLVAVGMGTIHVTEEIDGIDFLKALGYVAALLLATYLLSLATLPQALGKRSLWIVLSRDLPDPQRTAKVLDTLTALWKEGPVTWVIPEQHPVRGAHAYVAERIGELAALHPSLPHDIDNWKRALPPPHHWRSLKQRELHAPEGLLPLFLVKHLEPEDCVVVLTSFGEEAGEWIRALPAATVGIGWLNPTGDQTFSVRHSSSREIPIISLTGHFAFRRLSCSELLNELRRISKPKPAAPLPEEPSFEALAAEPGHATRKIIFAGPTIPELEVARDGIRNILLQVRLELEEVATRLQMDEKTIVLTQGASGSETIFMEICRERQIPLQLIQPLPAEEFVERFVAPAGAEWVARYRMATDGASASYAIDIIEPVTAANRALTTMTTMMNFPGVGVPLESHVIWLNCHGSGQVPPELARINSSSVYSHRRRIEILAVGRPPVRAA